MAISFYYDNEVASSIKIRRQHRNGRQHRSTMTTSKCAGNIEGHVFLYVMTNQSTPKEQEEDRMNLKQLEYFVKTAELLNFTRAAEKCFISQTAMTQQIRSLEETVGVPLFIRDKHHVELTAAGAVYLKEVRQILERSDHALRVARLAASGTKGELAIGYITGFGLSEAPRILRNFSTAYPDIRLTLVRDTMSGLMDSLEKGECDISFTLTPSQFHSLYPNIGHRYLESYPLMAVLPREHPLAGRKTVSYSDLKNERFIIMQPSARERDEMEEILLIYNRGGFMPEIAAFDREPETILLMILAGLGISIMPEYIVRHQHNHPDLRLVPVIRPDGSMETLDVELAWSETNTNPAVEKFLLWQQQN